MEKSRREFLIQSSAALAAAALVTGYPIRANSNPLGKPAGLQLYSVTAQLEKDFDGTLHQVRTIGYQEVEMAGFFGKKPAEIKRSLDNAGLHCGSMHIFSEGLDATLECAVAIGAKYIITSFISPDATRGENLGGLTLEDYKVMAGKCNHIGERAKKVGLQLAYHNHNGEFKPLPGGTGYDEFLKQTDPDLVKLELDCGWMSAAGLNPATYIGKYPDRYRLLHIKDFKPTPRPLYGGGEGLEGTELGHGHVDYGPIFRAAKKAIEWYYVEQEPPFKEMPVLEALKINFEYLQQFN
jgi:sugar phosphate isomerase/epimerase